MSSEYSLRGVVSDLGSGRPVAGVRVRAYDKDFFRDQLLGDGETDANGRYEVRFGRDELTGPVVRFERHPDLFVQVYGADGQLLHTTESSIVVDADRETSLDLSIPYYPDEGLPPGTVHLFGIALNLSIVSGLTASQVLDAYKLLHGLEVAGEERIKLAFPGLFPEQAPPPACGTGIYELFVYLMRERNALDELLDFEDGVYQGATVRRFFTANFAIGYTTDATLPNGNVNPHKLLGTTGTIPTADEAYTMPNGTLVGTVRANLADLDPENTEVAPTYVQQIGLLLEYSRTRFVNPPFSFRDPRGATRLEVQIISLPAGAAGYARGDFILQLNNNNDLRQNLGTVPHELFHLVQLRYNPEGGTLNRIRGCMIEGGAVLLEESITETPNIYVHLANEDEQGGPLPRKGIFKFPEESLLDRAGSESPLRYASGLLWKYVAEQHSTLTGAADEPAIGVDSYRTIIEQMVFPAPFSIAKLREARGKLPWYGTFDQFVYYDANATELMSHENTWANFLLANYLHRLGSPGSAGFDARFDYKEDAEAGDPAPPLETLGPVVRPDNAIEVTQGSAKTFVVPGHKAYAAVYYELTPSRAPAPRMLRVGFTTTGMSDPLVQIVRIGPGNALVDIHRSDRASWSKTINLTGLEKVVVVVASREQGGDYTINFDEVASAPDVMVTRWNTAVGREYEIDPKGWSWSWISPDVMVDTNDDGLDDTSVFFGRDNRLKVRLRNRGNAPANNIQVDFWHQKAVPYLTSAGWIPVRNKAGASQQLTGLSLAPGEERWFGVDWCPVDDGTHYPHWCTKIVATCPGDPNADNKMVLRNFGNLAVSGDSSPSVGFEAMIRFVDWTADDLLHLIPRAASSYELVGPGAPRDPVAAVADTQLTQARVTLGAPLDLDFIQLRPSTVERQPWDGRSTEEPHLSNAYYPTDPRTLPPGVDPGEIVTLTHVRNGRPFGGISYRLT